jgi:hypothetical protein
MLRQLAELWPQGYMDNVGIKDAISRSKDRKRLLYNQQKVITKNILFPFYFNIYILSLLIKRLKQMQH